MSIQNEFNVNIFKEGKKFKEFVFDDKFFFL